VILKTKNAVYIKAADYLEKIKFSRKLEKLAKVKLLALVFLLAYLLKKGLIFLARNQLGNCNSFLRKKTVSNPLFF
jgi:hypothetical protein